MLKNENTPLRYFAIILTFFLASCGYDHFLQYGSKGAASYRITMADDPPHKPSSVLIAAFKDEGLEPMLYADFGNMNQGYHISDKSSQVNIRLYNRLGYGFAIIAIYPARLNSISSKRKAQFEERKAAIMRIKQVLEQTDSFDEYILQSWEQ